MAWRGDSASHPDRARGCLKSNRKSRNPGVKKGGGSNPRQAAGPPRGDQAAGTGAGGERLGAPGGGPEKCAPKPEKRTWVPPVGPLKRRKPAKRASPLKHFTTITGSHLARELKKVRAASWPIEGPVKTRGSRRARLGKKNEPDGVRRTGPVSRRLDNPSKKQPQLFAKRLT